MNAMSHALASEPHDTEQGFGEPACRKAPRPDDQATGKYESDERAELHGVCACLDCLKSLFAIEHAAGAIEQRLIRADLKASASATSTLAMTRPDTPAPSQHHSMPAI